MSGPIVREGRIILGVELAMPKLNASPINSALADQQKSIAKAASDAATVSQKATAAIGTQSAAVEKQASAWDKNVDALSKAGKAQQQTNAWMNDVDAAVKEATDSIEAKSAAEQAAKDKAEKLAKANIELVDSSVKAAKGAMQMARGFALLAGSEDESIAAAVKHVFFIQGLLDVADGAVKVQKALAKAYAASAAAAAASAGATSSLTVAVNALNMTVAKNPYLIVGAVALWAVVEVYNALTTSTSEAAAAEQRYQDAISKSVADREAYIEQLRIMNDAQLERIGYLDTAAQKEEALNKARGQNTGAITTGAIDTARSGRFDPAENVAMLEEAVAAVEHEKAVTKVLLDLEKDQAEVAAKKIDDQIQLIELRERELKQSKDALKAEEEKSRAIRAQIGALNGGEQARLRKLLEAANNGDLTRQQALQLQKLGGQAGQDIAAVFLAKLDQGLGALAQKTRAKVTGEDPMAVAQAEMQRRRQAEMQATGGKPPEQAISDLQQMRQDIELEADNVSRALTKTLRELVERIQRLETEASQQRRAARQNGK
ncbi:hypothetical protein [Lacipirellula parvula]|uniref:Uncharacterized protein n=1 Tax=Lacipirellula parvula TaxID=2650471 RepID=A0A5K7XG66_9BACT|nr:hypothetical protein [Lacipirellula parvula]BBO31959.1 hypothetical protein PLANPX_1571 [Lacipirellula parvula]